MGGIWVRGLCSDCNSLAGGQCDTAYADFATRVNRWHKRDSMIHFPNATDVPPVAVAPGPVARSILYGMHAVSPQLRRHFPDLAQSLASGDDQVRIPPGLRLRVARYTEPFARVAGPLTAMRVLTVPQAFMTFAEVYFRPLAWVLTPDTRGLVFDDEKWASADEWPLYRNETNTDLRNLTQSLPLVKHPLAEATRMDWIEFHSDEITPFIEGSLPSAI